MFNSFRILQHGLPVRPLNPRLQSFLAYLILHRDAPQRRGRMAAALWPDSPEGQARTNLRKWLQTFRRTLPMADLLLLEEGDTMRWQTNASVRVDVIQFEELVRDGAMGSLRRAADLYAGDLLPELGDEWLSGARERLHVLYLSGLSKLVAQLWDVGEVEDAVRYGRQWISADPLQEEAYRSLMRMHLQLGEYAAAVKVYRKCARVLADELAIVPSPQTQSLYDEILWRNKAAAPAPAPAPPNSAEQGRTRLEALDRELFVGRTAELQALAAWAEAAEHPLLHVTGPGGIGKSALLRAFARGLKEQGRAVLLVPGGGEIRTPQAWCSAAGAASPQALVDEVNRRGTMVLVDALDEMKGIFAFLQEQLLPSLSTQAGVVLCGQRQLHHLWREDSPWLRQRQVLMLGPLLPAESRELLERRGLAEEALAMVRQVAGGHPLALNLAADLVRQMGARRFVADAAWKDSLQRVVRTLVGPDADVLHTKLLEIAALVYAFNQDLLSTIAQADLAEADFVRLSELPIVHATADGLLIDEQVREFLVEHLQWRTPERVTMVRERAKAYFLAKLATVPAAERGHWLRQLFYVFEDPILRQLIYPPYEASREFWLDDGFGDGPAELCALWAQWRRAGGASEIAPELLAFFERYIGHARARVRVARDRAGRPVGINMCLPVGLDTIDLLRQMPLTAWVCEPPFEPQGAEGAWHIGPIGYGGAWPEAVRRILLRDIVDMVPRGGRFYLATWSEPVKRLLHHVGFEAHPMPAHLLDQVPAGTECFTLQITGPAFGLWIHGLVQQLASPAVR